MNLFIQKQSKYLLTFVHGMLEVFKIKLIQCNLKNGFYLLAQVFLIQILLLSDFKR